MSCINVSHPAYKALAAQTGLKEAILKAKIGSWFNENGSERFPTAQELGVTGTSNIFFSSKNNISDSVVDWLIANFPQYHVNDYGIINTFGKPIKDAERARINDYLIMQNARYGTRFIFAPTSTNKFYIKNLETSYQLDNKGTPESAKVNKSLQKFMDAIGINVQTVKNMQQRFGIDAVAAADIMNKIIFVAEGKADITTLPEEVAHFFVQLLPEGHPLLVSMMSEIEKNPIYQQVYNEYKEIYKGDVNKIKREAIGKVIAEEIIKNGNKDTNERIVRWWNKVWDYIKNLFNSNLRAKLNYINEVSPELYNPYADAAARILEGNTRGLKKSAESNAVFFELSNQQSISAAYDNLRSRVTRYTTKNEKGQTVEDYRIDGVSREDAGFERATTKIRQRYNTADRSSSLDIDEIYAQQGTLVHNMIEHIITNVYNLQQGNPVTGFPLSTTKEKLAYADLKEVFEPFALKLYKEGAIIKIEQPVINTEMKLLGTIDMLVIHKDGTQDIYDFKTRNSRVVAFSKREEYSEQLKLYKKMITLGDDNFSLGKGKVGKTRIFGIYISRNKKKEIKSVQVDGVNLVVADEVTGDKAIDSKLEVLRYRLKALQFRFKSMYASKEKQALAERIEDLQNLIDVIVSDRTLGAIIEYGASEIIAIKEKLAKNKDFSYEELQNIYYNLLLYQNIDMVELEDPIVKSGLMSLATQSKNVNFLILKGIKAKLLEDAKQRNLLGIKDEDSFMSIDTPQSKLDAWWRGGSFTKDDYVKLINDLVVNAKERSRIKFEAFAENLTKEVKLFRETKSNYTDLIDPTTGNLYAKFSKQFFQDKQRAKQDKDWDWFKANFIVTEETKARYAEMVQNQEEVFSSLSEKALLARYRKIGNKYGELGLSMKDALLYDWKQEHPIEMYGELADEQKFYSEEFKKIQNSADLLRFYNYWSESMKELRAMTGKEFNLNMLPTIEKSVLDRFMKNPVSGVKGLFSLDWLAPAEENDESSFDPLTKEKLMKVPLLYTNQDYSSLIAKYEKQGLTKEEATEKAKQEFIDNKSKDLGAAMYMFAAAAFNNRAMQDIEHEAVAIKLLAKNLNSDDIASVSSVTGKPLTNTEKENIARNMHLTEEQVTDILETYVYSKKDNSNKEDKNVKEVLDKVGKFTALSRLALNFFSPVVNLLGGTANSYMIAAKRMNFTESDLNTGYGRHMLQDDKTKALYKLFPVLMEEFMLDGLDDVSLGVGKHIKADKGFVFQRIGDKTVQYGVLNAMLESHTVVDGKIVNKVKYLKDKYGYSVLKSATERQEVLKKVEEEAKNLKSVHELVELTSEGKVDIDKLGLSEQAIIDFKRKVTKTNKYIMGNTDPNDLAMIKRNMWGRQVMIFRSWIQALGDERYASKHYDAELDYTVEGRYITLLNIYKEKGLAATIKLQLGLMKGIDANLTEEEIANIRANARELQFILIGILAYSLTRFKDDKDKGPILKYVSRITSRLIDELTFFVNPKAAFNIIKTPAASSSVISDLGSLFTETIDFLYYGIAGTPEEYEDKVKLKRAIGKNIPLLGQGIKLYEVVEE